MTTFGRTVDKIQCLSGIKKAAFLVLCALIFALPFINGSLWIFGYIGLSGLFLIVLELQRTGKRVFGSLFLFFYAFYFFAYCWFINLYPLDFVGLGNGESVAVIVCAVTLIPLIHGALMSLCMFAGTKIARLFESDILTVLVLSSSYVVGEYLQSLGELAFPWTMLAVGQTERIELVQSASLFGSRFITFLIVAVNALLTMALAGAQNRKKLKRYISAALSLFLLNAVFGIVKVNVCSFEEDKTVTAVALQGNIPSGEKWRVGNKGAVNTYKDLADRTRSYLDENNIKADIAVLPETAFPSRIDKDSDNKVKRTAFYISDTLGCDTVVGAFSEKQDKTYNSLFVFSPGQKLADTTFDKQNLVPFGEFLPYRTLFSAVLPSVSDMNMFSSDIYPGDSRVPLETSVGKAACLVCFDSIFPENARLQVKNGAEYIVVSTNDSWYKTSVALEHHASHAKLRSIENGRSTIRSANTGISMIIDPNGRVAAKSGVGTQEFVIEKIPLKKNMTLYTLTGDLVLPMSALLVAFAFAFGMMRRYKKRLK